MDIKFIGMPEHGLDFVDLAEDSAVLQNDTSSGVTAISVQWRYTRPGDSTEETTYRIYVNWDEGEVPIMAPHSRLAISVSDLQDRSLQNLSGSASIDAVMFSDGTFVGDRSSGMARELKAKWKAESDVLIPFLQKVQSTPEQAFTDLKNTQDLVHQHKTDFDIFYRRYVFLFTK